MLSLNSLGWVAWRTVGITRRCHSLRYLLPLPTPALPLSRSLARSFGVGNIEKRACENSETMTFDTHELL